MRFGFGRGFIDQFLFYDLDHFCLYELVVFLVIYPQSSQERGGSDVLNESVASRVVKELAPGDESRTSARTVGTFDALDDLHKVCRGYRVIALFAPCGGIDVSHEPL